MEYFCQKKKMLNASWNILTLFSVTVLLYTGCLLFPHDAGIPPMTVFEKDGLKLDFAFEKEPSSPQTAVIHLTAINLSSCPMTDFLFQAAVPKVSVEQASLLVLLVGLCTKIQDSLLFSSYFLCKCY